MMEKEPYHVFPEHDSLDLGILVFLPLAALAAWFHSLAEPHIMELQSSVVTCAVQRRRGLLACFLSMLPYIALYGVPGCFVLATILTRSAGQDIGTVMVLATMTFAFELAANMYLFRINNNHIMLRIGRRLVFVACCVLLGAASTRSLLDRTDYYGPVRVTKFGVEMYRPAQSVSKSDPKWYYYYSAIQRLEWGHGWGCPSDSFDKDTWCVVTQELIDECSEKVNCHGKPYQTYITNTCVDNHTEALLISKVELCMLKKYSNVSVQTSFDKDVAPWMDSVSPYTVTYPTNCGNCTVMKDVATPQVLRTASSAEFIVGILLLVTGASLACLGQHRRQQEDLEHVYQPTASGDLQLTEVVVVPADHVLKA